MSASAFISDPPQVRRGTAPRRNQDIDVLQLPTVKRAPFTRLRMRHRRVIASHLQGASNVEIAGALGCSAAYVSSVLNNPTVIPILQRCYKEYEQEFNALTPLCIRALRENLESQDGTLQLKAVDLTFKRQGVYDRKESNEATAEDVIERILKITNKDGTRMEFSEKRFLKAGEQMRSHQVDPDPDTIDV